MIDDKDFCFECNKSREFVCPICSRNKAISSERERTAKEIFDEMGNIVAQNRFLSEFPEFKRIKNKFLKEVKTE